MSTKFYATLLVTILLTGIATPPLWADNSAPISDIIQQLVAQDNEQLANTSSIRQTRGQPDTPGKSCDHKGNGDPNHCNDSGSTPATTETTIPVESSTPTPPPEPVTSTPEPAPVTTTPVTPAPVVTTTPESKPVVTTTPESKPVVTTTPESKPVVTTTPESKPVATTTPEPTPVVTTTPEPAPVTTTAEPVVESPPVTTTPEPEPVVESPPVTITPEPVVQSPPESEPVTTISAPEPVVESPPVVTTIPEPEPAPESSSVTITAPEEAEPPSPPVAAEPVVSPIPVVVTPTPVVEPQPESPLAPVTTLPLPTVEETLPSAFEPPMPPTTPVCPKTGILTETCVGQHQTLTDVTINPGVSVSQVTLAGTILNQGWISNATILPAATVTGGTLTGTINNQGILSDITFRGEILEGGSLSGTVTVQKGAKLEQVTLLPNTHLDGGTLNNAQVMDGVTLTNVTLGKNTQLSNNMVIGQGVQFGSNNQRTTANTTPPHVGSGPTPVVASDTTFLVDQGATLDTSCRYRDEGPITIEIPITRVVGEVNDNGYLFNPQQLIDKGVVSAKATLRIPMYDIDLPKEIDEVWFNGVRVAQLTGANDSWQINTFQIPIEQVKFPKVATLGNTPSPAVNQVVIKIDTASSTPSWCTSVDWAALSFKAVSPVILMHGFAAPKHFFQNHGFVQILRNNGLQVDDSIYVWSNTILHTAGKLNQELPPIVKKYGVDSVHLVAHSKGGLDVRSYLANYYPAHSKDLEVLSYTSLSTPHNGSVLSDLLGARSKAIKAEYELYFDNLPGFASLLTQITGQSYETMDQQYALFIAMTKAAQDLSTNSMAFFNEVNLPHLPVKMVFNTVAADADKNLNGKIDRDNPDEYLELRKDQPMLDTADLLGLGRLAVDTFYQVLSGTASVEVNFEEFNNCMMPGEGDHCITKRATVVGFPHRNLVGEVSREGNDVMVTVPSGLGFGYVADTFANHVINSNVLFGGEGRNHSSVADGGVAEKVFEWIVETEKQNGDLR